jgi:hypothetical protein
VLPLVNVVNAGRFVPVKLSLVNFVLFKIRKDRARIAVLGFGAVFYDRL